MSDPNWKERLIGYLENEDREHAHQAALDALETGKTDIRTLYEDILAPALNRISGDEDREAETIWREHVMTGIVRGIVESAFPYVMRERDARGLASDEKVLVFCPVGEDHELGARMAADYFLIWGYQAVFIGANTPEKTLLDAIARTSPAYVCVSVSNDFNLFAARRQVTDLRSRFGDALHILAGGRAIARNPHAWSELGADRPLQTFEDIGRLRTGEAPSADAADGREVQA
ncbi:MAG: hypothetical protein KBA30_08375 [Clostridia bacterium]|nr:hypothetical protein [Clostridia bacterium]